MARAKKPPAARAAPKVKRKKTAAAIDQPKRKRGNQTLYTEEVAFEVCERLARGEPLIQMCRTSPHLPNRNTILGWVADNREGFAGRYVRARELGIDAIAEEIIDISDDASNDWMKREGKDEESPGYIQNGEHVQRSRLRVDARKWLLSKWMPQKYGDRSSVEMTGKDGKDLVPEGPVDKMELARWVAFTMISAREEAKGGEGKD